MKDEMKDEMKDGMALPGIGNSQRSILDHLKRQGPSTIPSLARELELSVETVRSHLRSLRGEGMVERAGRRRKGPGRPQDLYRVTAASQGFFPDRHAEILQGLVEFLEDRGKEELIQRFFEERVGERRKEAVGRLDGLEGMERLEEVAAMLSEEGFMADIETREGAPPTLRLSHCPIRDLVAVSRVPCRAELSLVRDLLGGDLTRIAYIPSGDAACSYSHSGR